MKRTSFTLAVALLAVFGIINASNLFRTAHAQSNSVRSEEHGAPEIIRHSMNQQSNNGFALTAGSTRATTAISYHGGALIRTPVVYVIWYGDWNQTNGSDNAGGQQIVRDFLQDVGGVSGSPYFLINTSYSTPAYNITGSVIWGGETSVAYPNGTSLGDASILTIVNNAINSNSLPYDANGVYFVLTSSDVTESSGFCTNYCGWHTAGTASRGHVRYSFVGNANRCLSSCAAQSKSPNGNAGVDGMISVVAHELEEAVTDPDPRSGWADARGQENADKCAWTFGHYQYLSNGAWANMHLGSRDYLIQRNLYHNLNGKDYCMMDETHN